MKGQSGHPVIALSPKEFPMPSSLVATLRRANRLMVRSAFAPLAAFRPKAPKRRKIAAGKAASALPKGARFETRSHRSAAGTRSYRIYLPASHPKRPKGLILMLHGCNQTPDDFAAGTHMNALAEKHGLAIAYPAQTGGHNAGRCWNWFEPGDQSRGAGEPAILAAMTRKLMKDFGLGREAVYVAGLSAGGAMAAILADVYPDVFSAAGVHSGLARGSASGMMSAMVAMRNGAADAPATPVGPAVPKPATAVRWIVFQGDADSTVHPSNAGRIVASVLGADASPAKTGKRSVRGRGYARRDFAGGDGRIRVELWTIEGGGHAWSGGRLAGSYTDAKGPDASAQMIRFFLTKPA